MNEKWIKLEGINPNYEVSNLGNVRNALNGKILSGFIQTTGYRQYSIHCIADDKVHNYFGHRLVALYFIPNPLNKPFINHINEDKLDNRMDNLEWCTQQENTNAGTVPLRMSIAKKKLSMSQSWKNKLSAAAIKRGAHPNTGKTKYFKLTKPNGEYAWFKGSGSLKILFNTDSASKFHYAVKHGRKLANGYSIEATFNTPVCYYDSTDVKNAVDNNVKILFTK